MDRGKKPVTLYLDLEKRGNVCSILGNHEYTATFCLEGFRDIIMPESIADLPPEFKEYICAWQLNGGVTTSDEIHKLSDEDKRLIIFYLYETVQYEEISLGGKDYILAHAGSDNFSPERPLYSYSYEETLWHSPDCERVYFKDKFLVTGHTPRRL